MPTYTVRVQYDASVDVEVEAESIEAAENKALGKAYSEYPTELYAYVSYVMDENGDEIEEGDE